MVTDVLGLEADTKPDQASKPTSQTSESFDAAVVEADSILEKLLADIAPVGTGRTTRRMMIYGDPGTRKTSFACGVGCDPEFNKGILNILVEAGGEVSLENHKETQGKVSVLKFRAIPQVEALIRKLAENPPALSHIHTVVVDTFTTLQERDLRSLAEKAAQLDASRNPNLPIGADYQLNTEHMKSVARQLSDLDRNVIVIAHVKEEKDESTGRLLVRPSLTPKLASTMAGMFDLVGYMSMDTNEDGTAVSTLQVHPTPKVIAKTRIGGLPAVIRNPKLTDILNTGKVK